MHQIACASIAHTRVLQLLRGTHTQALARKMAQFAQHQSRVSFRASTGESGLRVLPAVFRDRLLQLAEETVDSLQVIWQEAGYEETECQSLLGDLLNKMKLTCSSELAAEQQILEHAKQQVLSKLQDYTLYCAQLGRPTPADGVPVGNNYTDKLAELERLIGSVSGEVQQRQKLINAEFSAIEALVDTLGEPALVADQFSGPEGTPALSDLRLGLLKAKRAELEAAKKTRCAEMLEVAKACAQHMSDLVLVEEGMGSIPEAEGCAEVDAALLALVKTGLSSLSLSPHHANQTNLKLRLQTLAEEKERRREELAGSGAEIARLWTLLRIPSAEREQFQSSFKMNLSLATLAKGKEELERLKLVRVQSLGRVTASIRADILALWEEAGVETEEQRRNEFNAYFTPLDQLDDTAVDSHEAYFATIKGKVEALRPLLQKIARREVIAQERIELEHIQMNPERLSARGPNAREDRKREEGMHMRVKNIDKITKELMAQIQQWEQENGPFLYGGDLYSDRVAKQEESYVEIRDSLRNSRKKKDTKADVKCATGAPALPGKKAAMAASGSGFNPGASRGGAATKEPSGELNADGLENLSMGQRNSTGTCRDLLCLVNISEIV